jgi:hypothetical protein
LRGPGPSSAPSGSCQEKGLGASNVITAHATGSRARHAQRQTHAARRQPHAPAAWKMAACAASPWWRADSTGPRLATLSFHSHGLSVQFNGFCMLTNHSRWGQVSKKLKIKSAVLERSQSTSTPSTSIKETINTSFSSATPLTNMVSSLRRFSKGMDSQAPTGTTLHLSTHSSTWPPPNSGLAQFAVTAMPIPTLMTMPQALLHPMLVTEFLLALWGAYRVFFSLYVSFLSSLRYQDSRLEIS